MVDFALPGFVDCRLGARQGRLRMHHQPTLGHAVVSQLKTQIASGL